MNLLITVAQGGIGQEVLHTLCHVYDILSTLLRQLGLDDNKRTYYRAGQHR